METHSLPGTVGAASELGDSRIDARGAPAALFLAGLIPGVYEFFHPTFGFSHGFETVAIARNLVVHGTFGNPFAPAVTGPTAAVPPLYPLFLAALLKVFSPPVFALAADGANIAANALIAALLPHVSRVFYGDAAPGTFGGILWIAAMRLMPQWDVSFTVAGLLLICLATAGIRPGGAGCVWKIVTAGCLAGLVSLMNPATILITGPWVAFRLISSRPSAGYAARYAGIFVLTVALCNAPWLARNYGVWHALVIRTNFGMTVYSSNNDCAQSSLFKDNQNGCYQATHPVASASEIRLMQALGEVEYDRRRTSDTLAWVRSHPARFAELTLQRIVEYWFPDPAPSPRTVYAMWAGTLLSAGGLVLMIRRREPTTLFLGAVWLLFPLTYYIVVSCDRYRYPILWTSLLPAGYYLATLARAASRITSQEFRKRIGETTIGRQYQ